MSQALSLEKAQELLGSIRIPTAPSIMLELQDIMRSDEPDMTDVANAIERDVGISAAVLKTVNSSFFGLRSKVNSIRQATSLLGLINIGNIVAGLALKRAMEENGGEAPPEFWESPVNVAMAAARLAKRFGGAAPDEAYMLGLFQNAGEVLMMQRFPDYGKVLHEVRGNRDRQLDLEERSYQTNHAVVGYYISSSWGLPEHVQQIILRHHEATDFIGERHPDSERTLMALLKMAEHIDACFWGRRENLEWQVHGEAALEFLGISSLEFLDIADDMVELLIANQA